MKFQIKINSVEVKNLSHRTDHKVCTLITAVTNNDFSNVQSEFIYNDYINVRGSTDIICCKLGNCIAYDFVPNAEYRFLPARFTPSIFPFCRLSCVSRQRKAFNVIR